ncbi:MAG: DUF6338 family protein [bacterium]|nr:DUF6338 family protein [bacterium]MCY3961168.1 DUF6338 family protein [bacterium]
MSGFNALLLLLVGVLLPGSFFALGFEQKSPRYGRNLKDWMLRLAGLSAFWVAATAWPLHWLYASYWDDFIDGENLPGPLYAAPILYLLFHVGVGWVAGGCSSWARRRWFWFEKVFVSPEPTAWDRLFRDRTPGFIRCRLKSGQWVGGLYDNSQQIPSYASRFADERDVYIGLAAKFDQDSGAFEERDGKIEWLGCGLHLNEREIEFFEFNPLATREDKDAEEKL